MNSVDTAVLLISHGSSLSYSKKVFEEICEARRYSRKSVKSLKKEQALMPK